MADKTDPPDPVPLLCRAIVVAGGLEKLSAITGVKKEALLRFVEGRPAHEEEIKIVEQALLKKLGQ